VTLVCTSLLSRGKFALLTPATARRTIAPNTKMGAVVLASQRGLELSRGETQNAVILRLVRGIQNMENGITRTSRVMTVGGETSYVG